MTLLAISEDAPEDSLAFATSYGIEFPLLSDTDGKVASLYVGVTSDHAALPGVTIIGRDGRVVFRQVASAKDDRMSAAELLATLDATLGTSGASAAAGGYAPIDRAQLRMDVGGGVATGDATGVADFAALYPLGTHLLLGPWVGFEPRHAPLDLDAALVLREPIWHGIGALELGAVGGWNASGATGWNVGGRAGLWIAVSPSFSVQLGAGLTVHDGDETAAFATIGVARLLRVR